MIILDPNNLNWVDLLKEAIQFQGVALIKNVLSIELLDECRKNSTKFSRTYFLRLV